MGILNPNGEFFWAAYFFIVGSAIGSFLNVVIYRLPLGMSLAKPGSHCFACKTPIKPYHNIPILGYFILRGKCASCGAKFSPRYMMVELITAIIFAACYLKFGTRPESFVYMAFCSALIAVAFIDLDHMIIPDKISLPGIVVGLICAYFFLPITMQDSLLGLLVAGGSLFLLAVIVPGGMGGGDIKLMAMVGAFLGLKGGLVTIFIGSLIGSVIGGIMMIATGKGRKTKIPFGPYLVMGALLVLFYERELIELYIEIFAR